MLARERGDTLIEVMFSAAVLALIIVLSIGIMNKGSAESERAVEGTFVRQSIDSQTELLRYARDTYVNRYVGADTLWKSITSHRNVGSNSVLPYDKLTNSVDCRPEPGHNAFWLDTQSGNVVVSTTFTQPNTSGTPVFATPGNGMWIEVNSTNATDNYIDFYVYACWDSPTNGPNATSGTVVRLYAPTE